MYIEIKLPKCTVFLTPDEINRLLMTDRDLFCTALKRGKGITRARTKERQYGAKWGKYEGNQLDHIE